MFIITDHLVWKSIFGISFCASIVRLVPPICHPLFEKLMQSKKKARFWRIRKNAEKLCLFICMPNTDKLRDSKDAEVNGDGVTATATNAQF